MGASAWVSIGSHGAEVEAVLPVAGAEGGAVESSGGGGVAESGVGVRRK